MKTAQITPKRKFPHLQYKIVNVKFVKFCCRRRIQNVAIPLKFPPEANRGLWGGEG